MKINRIYLLLLTLFLASCEANQTTVYIQNTHAAWDTLDICFVYSPDMGGTYDCNELGEEDSILWQFQLPRTDSSTYFVKHFDFSELESSCCLKHSIYYKGEQVSAGSGGITDGHSYEVTRISNRGGAYLVDTRGGKDKPEKDHWIQIQQ